MVVKQATPAQYFDCDQILNAEQAAAFVAAGYKGALRYFPLNTANIPGCLTKLELQILLSSGLAVAGVQHVDSPPWAPTAALGTLHGNNAAQYASEIEYPIGGPIWLDLEGVAPGTPAQAVIDYCHAWYTAVNAANFKPGIYCGWETGLSDEQLWALPFTAYWKSYNSDQSIPERGWQIVQSTQKTLNGVPYDPNIIQADDLGDLPVFVYNS